MNMIASSFPDRPVPPASLRSGFGSFLHLVVVLALVCVFTAVTRAQPPPPEPAQLRFLFLDETPGGYFLKIDKGFKSISSAPYVISPAYLPGSLRPLEIYRASPIPNPETGEIEHIKVAVFTPPSTTTAALVIVTPRPALPGSRETPLYNVEFIDSNPTTFPGGSIRILNRGTLPMAGRFASNQVLAQPGSTKIISPDADSRGRVRSRVAMAAGGAWKLISDQIAIVKPDTRLTGILVYSPSGLKFRFSNDILAERGDPPPGHVWLTYTDKP